MWLGILITVLALAVLLGAAVLKATDSRRSHGGKAIYRGRNDFTPPSRT